ncbi:hypothetical protein MNV49_001787 [Pseudohyphozyma bogoriensis]|nr:hypothetical protein MNV49_001787 [Pseudohyphozyma bogoriensis]
MIIGEILNLVAYAFTEAILVTPLGALSVVVSAILSSIFLKEKLTLFGKVGCFLCFVGATIIALNGPQEKSTSTIPEFQALFFSVGFLACADVLIVGSLCLIFFVAPKYGKTHMVVYISICSMIGVLSVVGIQGLGSSILTSIRGNNQFKYWFMYFLIGLVIITLLTEISYLNKALELHNTSMVIPIYYVLFTTCTLVTSAILYQGFKASAIEVFTVVMGFLVIYDDGRRKRDSPSVEAALRKRILELEEELSSLRLASGLPQPSNLVAGRSDPPVDVGSTAPFPTGNLHLFPSGELGVRPEATFYRVKDTKRDDVEGPSTFRSLESTPQGVPGHLAPYLPFPIEAEHHRYLIDLCFDCMLSFGLNVFKDKFVEAMDHNATVKSLNFSPALHLVCLSIGWRYARDPFVLAIYTADASYEERGQALTAATKRILEVEMDSPDLNTLVAVTLLAVYCVGSVDEFVFPLPVVALSGLYDSYVLILHRPYILGPAAENQLPDAMEVCLAAAERIVDQARYVRTHFGLHQSPLITQHLLFMAGTMLVLQASGLPGFDPVRAGQAKTNLAFVLVALDEISAVWPAATSTAGSLRKLKAEYCPDV